MISILLGKVHGVQLLKYVLCCFRGCQVKVLFFCESGSYFFLSTLHTNDFLCSTYQALQQLPTSVYNQSLLTHTSRVPIARFKDTISRDKLHGYAHFPSTCSIYVFIRTYQILIIEHTSLGDTSSLGHKLYRISKIIF